MRTTSGMGVRDDVSGDCGGCGCLGPAIRFTCSGATAAAKLNMGGQRLPSHAVPQGEQDPLAGQSEPVP